MEKPLKTNKTETTPSPAKPTSQSPKMPSQHIAVKNGFTKALEDNTIFIVCAARLRQYQLERKYDPAYVINEAYLRACAAVDRDKKIVNFPGWIKLASNNIIRELSREEKKKQRRNQQLISETLPAPQAADWLNDPEATAEQLRMRAAFSQLSQLEQEILQLKVVKGLRWKVIQQVLVTAGYPLMNRNTLSQRKRRALKHLAESYKAIVG